MNKKISVGLTIAIAAMAAAIAFFAGSSMVRNKIEKTLIDVNEKQAMYSKLYELDQCIRANKDDEIDEKALAEGICRGYIDGLGESKFSYMTAEEFAQSGLADVNNLQSILLSDGSAVIIDPAFDKSENETENEASDEAQKTDSVQELN